MGISPGLRRGGRGQVKKICVSTYGDPTPEKVLYAKSAPTVCPTGLGKVSRLSSGLDPRISRDPTPKKVLYAKSGPLSNRSWLGQDFLHGWIPECQGIQPWRKFYTRRGEVKTYVKHVLTWSRLSPGLDPRISRDPTPKKVLYAKSGPSQT